MATVTRGHVGDGGGHAGGGEGEERSVSPTVVQIWSTGTGSKRKSDPLAMVMLNGLLLLSETRQRAWTSIYACA